MCVCVSCYRRGNDFCRLLILMCGVTRILSICAEHEVCTGGRSIYRRGNPYALILGAVAELSEMHTLACFSVFQEYVDLCLLVALKGNRIAQCRRQRPMMNYCYYAFCADCISSILQLICSVVYNFCVDDFVFCAVRFPSTCLLCFCVRLYSYIY